MMVSHFQVNEYRLFAYHLGMDEAACIGGVHCFSLSIGNFYMFTAFMADFIVTSIQYTDDI